MTFTLHPRIFMTYIFIPLLIITSGIIAASLGGTIQDGFIGWFPLMTNGLERLVPTIVGLTILWSFCTSAWLGFLYKKHSLLNYAIITGLQFFNTQLLLMVHEAAPVYSPFKIILALGAVIALLSFLGHVTFWLYLSHKKGKKPILTAYIRSFNKE